MKLIQSLLFGLLFVVLGVVEDTGGGADHKKDDGIPELDAGKVKSWAEEGKKAGQKVAAMLGKAENVMQTTILLYAKAIAGTASAEDFLTGYSMAFDAEQTRKNRKSEAKAIFGAWASNHNVERVDTSTAEKLELARKGTPEKITKTTQEWLGEYKGGYHGFVQLAKDMAPKSGDASTNTGQPRARTLTDKKAKAILAEMSHATGAQADGIMAAAISAVKRQPGFEKKMFGHIVGLCNEIKVSTKDEKLLNVACEIIDSVSAAFATAPIPAAIPTPAAAAAGDAKVDQSEPQKKVA